MSKLLKVLDLLMSDIAVACYAAVIAVVVFAKGLPVIGGIGLGVSLTKLWSAIAAKISSMAKKASMPCNKPRPSDRPGKKNG